MYVIQVGVCDTGLYTGLAFIPENGRLVTKHWYTYTQWHGGTVDLPFLNNSRANINVIKTDYVCDNLFISLITNDVLREPVEDNMCVPCLNYHSEHSIIQLLLGWHLTYVSSDGRVMWQKVIITTICRLWPDLPTYGQRGNQHIWT